jgi:thiamine biosynthesis protein ThiI
LGRLNGVKAVVLIHYGEIGLKGKNIDFFLKRLRDNVRKALKGLVSPQEVNLGRSRITVELSETEASEEGVLEAWKSLSDKRQQVESRLQKVFGIQYFGVGLRSTLDMETIERVAADLLTGETFKSFRVDAKRSNKAYHLTSPEINSRAGAFLQSKFGAEVKLKDADITAHIEIGDRESYVYTRKVPGPGGFPTGVSGKVVALLSAGFDSPVASYQMMKRGAEVVFVHFHSYPFISRDSIDQATALAKVLTAYQFHSRMYLVPFAETQQIIVANTPAPLRVILYRRMMVRIAEAVAKKEWAEGLITGESLGQVASQTLRNMRVIDEVASFPILRPLVSFDKSEIIDLARKIGTFELSSAPYDDCCSFLLPKRPNTWASPEEVASSEQSLDIEQLVEQALSKAQVEEISCL